MSSNPEYAPSRYLRVVRRMVDVEGVEVVLVEDHDGVRFVMDADVYEESWS